MITGLQRCLDSKNQALLFLNRRGFSRVLTCNDCGEVVHCKHCEVPMTYHLKEDYLLCHLCGYTRTNPKKCLACQSKNVNWKSFGTQKIEGLLKSLFPQAKIARVDADTTQKKQALDNFFDAFRAQKIDILIGTQMITKGLDFPNIALVGALNADLGLNVADFRASERNFQLLTQVAGRGGRGDLSAEVIIQTFSPHQSSIQFSRHHDYEGFSQQELALRQQLFLPPFTHLSCITIRSTKEELAKLATENLHRRLKQSQPKGLILGNPLPSPLTKSLNYYRFQLLLRGTQSRQLLNWVSPVLKAFKTNNEVQILFDMDAIELN